MASRPKLYQQHLSARPLEALRGLAAGKKISELAAERNVLPTAIARNLECARVQLGARTTYQALVMAERLGLLNRVGS